MSYEAWGEPEEGPQLPEGWWDEDQVQEAQERIESLVQLIGQFDAAIRRVATALTGKACGGVDTGDNINPETGEPYGHGGHTGWQLESEAKRMRGLLLWALYYHQGGSSEVGQPIRRFLGIGEYDHLTPEQIAEAKKAAMWTDNP